MTAGKSTYSDVSSLIPSIYQAALETARENTIMANLVTPYGAEGMTPRVVPIEPSYPTAQQKSEGVDYANPTAFNKTTNETLTPAVWMDQAILTDERMSTDPEDAMAKCQRWLGLGMANTLETNLLGLFSSFTNTIGSAGTTITLKYVMAAITKLRNSIKGPTQLYVVLHPYHWYVLWNSMTNPAATYEFPATEYANAAMRSSFVSNMFGALWFQHSGISINGDTDAYSAVFAREAIALDMRQGFQIEPQRDASAKLTELNGSMAYAYGTERADYGCYLLFDAATPTGA